MNKPLQRLASGFQSWCEANDSKFQAASFDDFMDFCIEIGAHDFFNIEEQKEAYNWLMAGGAK